nr:unnamed protein product [Digitaria exilis]
MCDGCREVGARGNLKPRAVAAGEMRPHPLGHWRRAVWRERWDKGSERTCMWPQGGHSLWPKLARLVPPRLASPPASSFLHYDHGVGSTAPTNEDYDDDDCDDYDENEENHDMQIIATHGDSVLLEKQQRVHRFSRATYDYFVYRASSAAAARPASLSLLPERRFLMKCEEGRPTLKHPREHMLFDETTGLLRRSDDELLVVDLRFDYKNNSELRDSSAELCVLRHGGSRDDDQWELIREVPIVLDNNGSSSSKCSNNKLHQRQWRCSNRVIPVSNRFLCWVDYIHGLLMCDMDETKPKLRYVPLPMAPFVKGSTGFFGISDDNWIEDNIQYTRNMCASGSDDAVRLVSIDPRCCCGGPVHGWSTCSRSRFAFTITTWTLSLTTMDDDQQQPMAWVKEGVIDSEEIWAQRGCEEIPHVLADNPVVSMENPDVVCFTVRERGGCMGKQVWLIEVDTKSKAVQSVCTTQESEGYGRLPAKLMCADQ